MTDRPTSINHNSQSLSSTSVSLLTVVIGVLVGGNFAVAKFAVLQGTPPFAVLFWLLLGASLILLTITSIRGQQLCMKPQYLRYYIIGGILGIGAPQMLSYQVLKYIPAGFFTMVVTLSPLFTFVVISIYERKVLPVYRLIGILIGFSGVILASATNINTNTISIKGFALALCVPVLLGFTNLYRSKAYPENADPLSLATGTLLFQTVLLWPILFWTGYTYMPLALTSSSDIAVIALAMITALSYILTYELQSRTDGVGFSQVGYFVTLTGVLIGAIFFNETIGVEFIIALALLFLGLAITNGHIKFRKK